MDDLSERYLPPLEAIRATVAAEARESQQQRIAAYKRRLRRQWKVALVLFVATCASTWSVAGPVYAAAVMGILLAHEFGHFFQAVRYRVPASPPFFIPMPNSPLGTMGAVISQAGGVADRKALFDIAITWPLAGLVLALPIAWLGIQQSTVRTILPATEQFFLADPPILRWLIYLKHGPLSPYEVVERNPLFFAGRVGIFVTALNLIPIGQLDGGHILYTLIGKRAHVVSKLILATAVGFMVYTNDFGYLLLILLMLWMGPLHPPTAADSVPIGLGRHILGWLTLAFVLIGFTPRPTRIIEPPVPVITPDHVELQDTI